MRRDDLADVSNLTAICYQLFCFHAVNTSTKDTTPCVKPRTTGIQPPRTKAGFGEFVPHLTLRPVLAMCHGAMFHRGRIRAVCSRTMNRHLLAPVLLLLTIPLAAQTPTTTAPQAHAARPRPARGTPPP